MTVTRPNTARTLRGNGGMAAGLFLLAVLSLFAFLGPLLVPYTYDAVNKSAGNLTCFHYSAAEQAAIDAGERVFPHVLGTDTLGRDILARLMMGTRLSMVIGVCAALIVLVVGGVYGAVSGYAGGVADAVMMRVVDILYCVPEVLVVLLLLAVLSPILGEYAPSGTARGAVPLLIAFALIYWMSMSRIVRGQVMRLKSQDYITAARALGASGRHIVLRHLLPNCMGQILVTACLQIPGAIFLESSLSFLGLGVMPPMTSLGAMTADAVAEIYTYPYRLVLPCAVLSVMILSFNLLGDGLRDLLDPRLRCGAGR